MELEPKALAGCEEVPNAGVVMEEPKALPVFAAANADPVEPVAVAGALVDDPNADGWPNALAPPVAGVAPKAEVDPNALAAAAGLAPNALPAKVPPNADGCPNALAAAPACVCVCC